MSAADALQGDEGELFERHYERLRLATTRSVRTTPENIEDACVYAFMELMRAQPRRETVFGWLRIVARQEAVRLDQRQRARSLPLADNFEDVVPDRRDPIAASEILMETRSLLTPLPEREKAAVLLRGFGWSYDEAAERLGISDTRINQLLRRAAERIGKQREQATDRPTHPRARLLEELLRDPPPFLRGVIGRPPPASYKTGGFERRLEWSRLALSIVDFRVARGIADPARALGGRSDEEARELEQRIEAFGRMRDVARGRGVER